ncbi:hypothetical protein L6164_029460 [Bauhinia variegata]|uniref:Uncharacterized protein n=1 Tax=Bauhinia variegata TaxID=167791 RepID=A0ACB9L9A5_BAUVA|nr:hypothetical protein L6164_029460 [Bauhinia variegata]
MAPAIFFALLFLLLFSASSYLQLQEDGFISVALSDKGLDYAKDLLIEEAISSVLSLQVPQIKKSVDIPLIGNAYMVLSDISIDGVQIISSYLKTGESGVVLIASDATANLTMNWRYSYSGWLLPIEVSDRGGASVKVEGMEVGLAVDLKNQEGTLKLILLNYGCFVGNLSIKLDGGASWLYQRIVDTFNVEIEAAVEDAISGKIREGISKLDNSLQSLPKHILVDNTAALNVSFTDNPVFSNSSVKFEIDGLFTGRNEVLASNDYQRGSETCVSCGGFSKMIKISLHENVFKSASLVYFKAGYMQWIVDELPDQALLNTAGWRFIIPKLYRQYPNDDMNLNISVSSPPIIQVTDRDVDATIYLDIIIDVIDAGEVIPVVCISMEISASCAAQILRNNIAGNLSLKKFSTYLKWSKIGNLRMYLIQPVMSVILRTVFLPYVNLHLRNGFPLPVLHGFTLQNAHIFYTEPWITVCSDVTFSGHDSLPQLPAYSDPVL